MMSTREVLHRLLYLALIEIRTEAYDHQNKKIFHLADLFHTIPLQLEGAAEGKGSYDEVLAWLRERAQQKGCEGWLDKVLELETEVGNTRG
jgi:hypothetical protein